MILKRFFISMLGALTAIWVSVMLVVVLGMMFAVGAIVKSVGGSPKVQVKEDNTILCLSLDNAIDERTTTPNFMDLVNDTPQPSALSDIISAVRAAKDDDRIAGIYLRCNGSSAGLATREAIRQELASFREGGKWVIAYGDAYSQGDYYVASVADELFLNPVGEIDLRGLASAIPYFKGFLDKVGVEMQIVKVGTFKSAVEPYTLTHMSEANRLQTTEFLNTLWGKVVDEISDSRGISEGELNQMADSLTAMAPASQLVDFKLVDALKYANEVKDYLKGKTGRDTDDDLPMVTISEYLSSDAKLPWEKSRKNKIAVYYAFGDITEDGRDGIASSRVVPDILKLAEDDDIDAMVLRVNSGGGSAFASEQIWHALEVFKSKGKTFYVSMGDYAASGGYYISCGAEKIFAEPLTLTGSIGIFGMIPCVKELATDKLGINVDFVTTNANGDMLNLFQPMTPFQRRRLQGFIDRGYDLFTSRCAEGRHMSQDSIKAIAEGRVWAGITAQKIGLVDELGSLTDAIKSLAEAKGYGDKFQVISCPDPKATFWDIISDLENNMKAQTLKEELGAIYPAYKELKSLEGMDPVQARMPLTVVVD